MVDWHTGWIVDQKVVNEVLVDREIGRLSGFGFIITYVGYWVSGLHLHVYD